MIIEIIDTFGQIKNKEDIKFIREFLFYEDEVWLSGQFRKIPKKIKKYLIDSKGYFLLGFLDAIIKKLNARKIEYEIIDENKLLKRIPYCEPSIKGITFRPDQIRAIKSVTDYQRGVILFPTASGKTVIAGGIFSCYPELKKLFLVHRKSLLYQTRDEFKSFGLGDATIIGDGNKEITGNLVIAMIKTLSGINPDEWMNYFDVTVIDECHRASSATFKRFMELNLSPIKIGLTATMPDEKKDKKRHMTIRGLIGSTISNLSYQEASEKKIISKIKINLIPVFTDEKLMGLKNYVDIYDKCITNNLARNRAIAKIAFQCFAINETVLIMIRKIAHGIILQNLIEKKPGMKSLLICAGPPSTLKLEISKAKHSIKSLSPKRIKAEPELYESRVNELTLLKEYSKEICANSKNQNQIKKDFNDKKIDCIICSDIWREGVNIKSLGNVINGCGGKSEIETIQVIGRGLRITETKRIMKLYDFLDPYHFLASHTIERIKIYQKFGWL